MVNTGFVMDRDLQRDLLLKMRSAYPQSRMFLYSDPISAQVFYLEEHGLCSVKDMRRMSTPDRGEMTITARGLDFLEEDGGLSAILGVVTVKLHSETIRQLIEAKIDQAEIPDEEKSALRKALATLPQIALQAATSDLVRAGLNHMPMHWVESLFR
ncbi:hypothetical protein [Acidisoma sp. C75]